MSLSFAIAIYFIIWWLVLFAVLPFGVRTQDEAGSVVPGTPESAPARPDLARLFLINTVVAAVVFAAVWAVITFELIDTDTFSVINRSPV
jgi:predicted secreted protein